MKRNCITIVEEENSDSDIEFIGILWRPSNLKAPTRKNNIQTHVKTDSENAIDSVPTKLENPLSDSDSDVSAGSC